MNTASAVGIGVAAHEHVRVDVLRDELREHHPDRRQQQPAPEPRLAHEAHRGGHARRRWSRRPPPRRAVPSAAAAAARAASSAAAAHSRTPQTAIVASGPSARAVSAPSAPPTQPADARSDREHGNEPLAGQRVEVVAGEGPEVVREHALGQVVGRDQREQHATAPGSGAAIGTTTSSDARAEQHLREQRVVARRADQRRVDRRIRPSPRSPRSGTRAAGSARGELRRGTAPRSPRGRPSARPSRA